MPIKIAHFSNLVVKKESKSYTRVHLTFVLGLHTIYEHFSSFDLI